MSSATPSRPPGLFFPLRLSRALAPWASVVALWLFYVIAIEGIAYVLLHDPQHPVAAEFEKSMHHFVGAASTLPALCRWDCAWYVSIAKGPYPGLPGPDHAPFNTSFFPLYGLAMRVVATAFAITPAWAAIWISRVSLLGSMLLLYEIAPSFGLKAEERWAAVVGLVFSPDAFVLLGGYADGLFLFLSLFTFALVLSGRPLGATIPAACAGITRIHAFPFVFGLAALGVTRIWKLSNNRDWRRALVELAPAAACGTAILGLLAYFYKTTHDPLIFIHQQGHFGKYGGGPLVAAKVLWGTTKAAWPIRSIEQLYWGLQPIVAFVWCGVIAALAWTRSWVALVYVVVAYWMMLTSGTHWGAWRYLAEVFPTWFAIARVQRWKGVWAGALLGAAVVQVCLLEQFVGLRAPGP